ncbi:SDR family oxidoreductase [Actinoplanes sp. NPDC051470]|uniref:SDR family oxidoreductase n=1 Tax=Actinoplanes sp. NPDC051470 TaxID=3157224 RepID=UPI00342EC4DE
MTVTVVSGATGRLGGRIARLLDDQGVQQRLLVRDASRAPRLGNAEVAVAEYADREAMRRALDGAGTVLMVSGAESADRMDHHRAFVDAAADAGVGHIVYTSFYRAAPDATFTLARDHWATEEYLRAKGLTFTSLRDNLYADFLPMMAGDDGVIRGPGGNGRASLVAQDDIASAAAAVVLAPEGHAGRVYDLTGPEDLSFAEAAAIISRVTGRPVRFHDETLEEAYASRAVYNAPGWQVDAWVSTYTAVAAGELAGVSGAVEELTGHPAMSLEQLLTSK